MYDKQYIILCLRDKTGDPKEDYKYVQSTRRRFSLKAALDRIEGYAPSRLPLVVEVPPVPVDKEGYPTVD